MINGYLEQFLDTGWYSESTLYLDGYIYWCEAQTDRKTGISYFFVDKWEVQNENNTYYHSIIEEDGTLKWSRIYEKKDKNLDAIKQSFLKAPIFDNKTFWKVENKIAWLDESDPIIRKAK